MTKSCMLFLLVALGQAGVSSIARAEGAQTKGAQTKGAESDATVKKTAKSEKVAPVEAKAPVAKALPSPFRGVLGVMVGHLTPKHREMLGAPPTAGVVVRRVVPGSIAEVMGMKKLDVIVDVAGATARSASDVGRALSQMRLGDLLIVQVIRDERPTTLFATLVTPQAKIVADAPKAKRSLSGRLHFVGDHSGVVIRPIDLELPRQRQKPPARRRRARR